MEWLTDAFTVLTGATNPAAQVVGAGTSVIGIASLAVRLLGAISTLTPSKKDDEFVGSAERFMLKLTRALDMIAFNPDANMARRPKNNLK